MTITRIAFCASAAALTLALAAPTPSQAVDLSEGLSGANVGTVGGAVAGGVGGNYLGKKAKLGKTGTLAATIGGTIAGGMLGGALGKSLDSSSRARAETAQMQAVSTGTRQTWQSSSRVGAYGNGTYGNGTWGNGASGPRYPREAAAGQAATGTVQPGNPYQTESGICRDYTHTITVDGRRETARGIACRNPDGTWHNAG